MKALKTRLLLGDYSIDTEDLTPYPTLDFSLSLYFKDLRSLIFKACPSTFNNETRFVWLIIKTLQLLQIKRLKPIKTGFKSQAAF